MPRAGAYVGKAEKYHYYKITVNSTDSYVGTLAFGPNPGSGNARFNVWVSEQPGQAALSSSACASAVSNESSLRYVTNIPAAGDTTYCKLTAGTYYVNIADGVGGAQAVTASSKGNCTMSNGCAYYLEVTGTPR